MAETPRMVVGITGASGIVYGIRILEILRELKVESHLIVSKAGELTRAHETDYSAEQVRGLADYYYPNGDLAAPIASGSFRTMGGIIAPPVPAFYSNPTTIEDLVDHTVGRALDLFGLDANNFPRWGRELGTHAAGSPRLRDSPPVQL